MSGSGFLKLQTLKKWSNALKMLRCSSIVQNKSELTRQQVVSQIEAVVEEWCHLINVGQCQLRTKEDFMIDFPPEQLPLAESNYWRARNENLEALQSQVMGGTSCGGFVTQAPVLRDLAVREGCWRVHVLLGSDPALRTVNAAVCRKVCVCPENRRNR